MFNTISKIYERFAPVKKGFYASYSIIQPFLELFPEFANDVIKNLKLNFSAAIGNIYAHVAPVKREKLSTFYVQKTV